MRVEIVACDLCGKEVKVGIAFCGEIKVINHISDGGAKTFDQNKNYCSKCAYEFVSNLVKASREWGDQ